MFPILQWKTVARLLSGAGLIVSAGLDVSAEVEVRIAAEAAYLKHEGNPLVAVWGIGFDDGRAYTLEECRELVEFLKADGCAVMLGIPTGWPYLRPTGAGAKRLRGEITASEQLSVR